MIRITATESAMGAADLEIAGWTKARNDSLSTQCFLSPNGEDEIVIIMHPNESDITQVNASVIIWDGQMKSKSFTIEHDMSGQTNLYDEIQLALNKNIPALFYQ